METEIKIKKWSPEELELFKELLKSGRFTLVEIANKLGRTLSSCENKLHQIRKKDCKVLDKKWTPKELELLNELTSRHLPWDEIAKQLPDRTANSCSIRWRRKTEGCDFLMEKWSPAEVQSLNKMRSSGLTWEQIAEEIAVEFPGLDRTPKSCAHKWQETQANHEVLKTTNYYTIWTNAEKELLKNLVQSSVKSPNWEYIAEQLPGRNQGACKRKWLNITRNASTSSVKIQSEFEPLKGVKRKREPETGKGAVSSGENKRKKKVDFHSHSDELDEYELDEEIDRPFLNELYNEIDPNFFNELDNEEIDPNFFLNELDYEIIEEEEDKEEDKDEKPTDKGNKRKIKSVKRKSIKRKSIKRRKSVKRKSVKRKSVKRFHL